MYAPHGGDAVNASGLPDPLTCCHRGCKATVLSNGWNVPCCLMCGREYPKCEKHGGQAAGRRSLRSHRGLCIGESSRRPTRPGEDR